MFLNLVFLTAVSFLTCDCANILGIIPTPAFSHQRAYANLWKELSLKGHKVTVLTSDPQNNPNLTNLTEIDISIGYDILEQQFNWSTQLVDMNPLKFFNLKDQIICKLTDSYLNLPEVHKLINNNDTDPPRFDVVMVEYLMPEFLMFGEFFKAPTILLSSFDVSNLVHARFQNGHHLIVYPDIYLPFAGELSFTERLTATLIIPAMQYIASKYLPARQNIVKKHFGNIPPVPFETLLEKCSMLFVSANPILMPPRPLSPRTIIIGGGSTIEEPKKLDKDIQDFLDRAKNGAIYFSLGSNVKSENLGQDTIAGIIEMLKGLPYSVLWKLDNVTEHKLPGNIMAAPWLSQQNVLRHPNIKLFITQGGMQSFEEAIYFEIPMVGIPIFSDQQSNARKLESKGVLRVVSPKPSLNPVALKQAILEVLENKSYSENIKKLNQIQLDQPMSGMERAVWWTEYVIRHKGNVDHMIHKPANTIPFYQYYFLDIFLFLILLLFSVLGLSYFIFLFLFRQLFRIFKNRNLDSSKKLN